MGASILKKTVGAAAAVAAAAAIFSAPGVSSAQAVRSAGSPPAVGMSHASHGGLTTELKMAGRRPVSLNVYRHGDKIQDANLRVFDAQGNVVKRLAVSDRHGGRNARLVGSWDLTNMTGRQVRDGTYTISGTVRSQSGRSENVNLQVFVGAGGGGVAVAQGGVGVAPRGSRRGGVGIAQSGDFDDEAHADETMTITLLPAEPIAPPPAPPPPPPVSTPPEADRNETVSQTETYNVVTDVIVNAAPDPNAALRRDKDAMFERLNQVAPPPGAPAAQATAAAQPAALTDPRDGKSYRTVRIGGLTWTAQDLNFGIVGSHCYGNDAANCEKYGRLYTWDAAMKACPAGWRLPTENDWKNLVSAVGEGDAAVKLKSRSGWSDNGNGTDNFGFTAVPLPSVNTPGVFGLWWSAKEHNAAQAIAWMMTSSYDFLKEEDLNKSEGHYVRCVQE